ncbi:hypothetical protein COCCADRAFT_111523 [Bipolaris zeicola 26-R-13]|uniref:HTH psq-type domain-containing protein n=1 Tax=Cochliobolus carbonum (strain 26-R-13) TaxID=930089 RepID=W6Y8U3_COCC2|nr:uncharacterized protein COCCADRAFT_111523 [Bipolaris zeicola 26-R-13]EUC27501.1 hypothetical protein COCCADRAFT_111523 [Bipolaris zeicola 26-R-13]
MPQKQNAILIQQEGRITLAVQAFHMGQFKSVRQAAATYSVRHQQVSRRLQGITFRPQAFPNCRKLTIPEKQTIVQYIPHLFDRICQPTL